ncbi:Hsp20/alpha crystallin family protein [Pseudotabrizicola algicola]|uniref:Hsp20/alpha crystallin family protein n=1 Tax=Pseudotabrizicola algicola TaxID=2709381 RepID=A0A6B3RTN2_9RHOB|nr:Hsp20/alpha crystallin family protein [Pseudotabrizicola algicola]NEX48138.1 Hsp20/alpha crystallin family protein [Pseudotabrizicola algicola]
MTTEVTKAPEQTPAEAAAETTRNRPLWRPLTDIVETKDGVTLMLELPGVAAEDVDVALEKRVLTIRARSRETGPDKLRLVHAEYEPGDYERAFTLSEDFDADRIEAEMKNGVLTLRLPRSEATQPKTVKVRAA